MYTIHLPNMRSGPMCFAEMFGCLVGKCTKVTMNYMGSGM